MATFTTFAFGTGESSTMKKKNIISQFSEACTNDKLVLEGPGMLGKEVKANTKLATRTILDWLAQQPSQQNTLNLSGFSRGSVTCIQIANRLKRYERFLTAREARLTAEGKTLLERLRGLEIHIFAMDPVAGLGDKNQRYARIIPDNVKSYVSVLQTDEMRRDFKPQDITRAIIASPQTKVSMLPMFGNHSDTTKIKSNTMQSGAKLCWYALHEFLTEHGTTFNGNVMPQLVDKDMNLSTLPTNPSTKDLLNLFSDHHLERDHYLKSGQRIKLVDGIPLPRKQRSLNKHLDYYVKNADFFVNQLERELFKLSYPKTFNYLFEQNLPDLRFPQASHCEKEDVIAELLTIRNENPTLFTKLLTRGVGETDEGLTLDEPAGVFCLEPSETMLQVFPNLVPDEVKLGNPGLNKLCHLEQDVYRLTFRYEREKSEFSPFSHRHQAHRSHAIRQEIQHIVNHQEEDAATKYHRILDTLEYHYRYLVKANSESELSALLKNELKKHGRTYQVQSVSVSREILASVVHGSLSLLKETISFIGHLGYVGGGVLTAVGSYIQDIGRRINESLGKLGYNPLKYVTSAVGYLLEGVGFAIKHSFGLKDLTNFITNGIRNFRDAVVNAIGPKTVERQQPVPVQPNDLHDVEADPVHQFKQQVQELRHERDAKLELNQQPIHEERSPELI
ncbi:DUF5621 domain-containing protein [Legionella impletisoli]|uniref:DUF5621 domain-containing protein n=1 Tax=Legionella impletisoli TaxID=343510 RepID=A0A917NDF4_9GAMM|nr:DUF5621 domain-containing protein [Legionella impletisoli]GGI87105.1 hypothetical protein GCM10007966_14780 [Legionella impletisoli]